MIPGLTVLLHVRGLAGGPYEPPGPFFLSLQVDREPDQVAGLVRVACEPYPYQVPSVSLLAWSFALPFLLKLVAITGPHTGPYYLGTVTGLVPVTLVILVLLRFIGPYAALSDCAD